MKYGYGGPCPVPLCPNLKGSPEMLMCSSHWWRVKRPIRSRVWAMYRRMVVDGTNYSKRQWKTATKEAIDNVTVAA